MTALHSLPRVPAATRLAPVIFTATIFLSASLLFFVQPLFTKIVMPQIGGAPAVWTTAMLFFQTVLIAGYAYAHFSTKYLPVAAQIGLHLALWAAALVFLPLSIASGWVYDAESSTVVQTLGLFAMGVGLPFAVLSANAPLIQSWYSKSGGPSADDPYFLYGASNLGSLIALLGFPLVAEPLFGAGEIGFGWAAGFVLLGGFLLTSGLMARGAQAVKSAVAETVEAAKPTYRQMGWWLLLAFIPSSLMLGVTAKISTDIGSFPLVWAIPLSLYLLTFVMTFTQKAWISDHLLRLLMIVSIPIMVALVLGAGKLSLNWGAAGLLVFGFFVTALMAHRSLYNARPGGKYLTQFYVIMSVGGALGGLFNSIIAPAIFNELHEVRVVVILASLLLMTTFAKPSQRDVAIGVLIGLATYPLQFMLTRNTGDQTSIYVLAIGFALLLGIWAFRNRPVVACVASTIALGAILIVQSGNVMFKDRSFFGAHTISNRGDLRVYLNGTTLHGSQRVVDGKLDLAPQSYYHRNGPLAQILLSEIGDNAKSIGVIGLGVGSLACYAQPNQSWQFYEIDKTVDDIARNPDYFTFMSGCAGDAPTHLGDARIVLERQTDVKFDLLYVDAFNSDAVPMHLTTTEAMALYRDRLTPDGVLVYHISNRYYDLSRPLARSAEALGMTAHLQNYGKGAKLTDKGDVPSRVVVMSRDGNYMDVLPNDGRWEPLVSDGGRLWTDDFANLLEILE